jgi:hypothetical protein
MTALERLRNSDAWDHGRDMPTANAAGNPWIYSAYADLVLRLHGERLSGEAIVSYWAACAVGPLKGIPNAGAGLFFRRPDRQFGNTSHDEVMGAAHLNRKIGQIVLQHLDWSGGDYNPLMLPEDRPGRWNLYRMIWLRPYLVAAAGFRMSPMDQVIWSLKLLVEMWSDSDSSKTGPGPRLRAWLMSHHTRKHALCALAWRLYRWRMERKGCTLKHDLEQEPAWPVLSELATNKYEHPA